MKIILDIECNALINPTHIWLVVCKDVVTGQLTIFRRLTENHVEAKQFIDFLSRCDLIIGHNLLGYDLPIIWSLLNLPVGTFSDRCLDTLICSKLIDYPREAKHSLESYGLEFNLPKGDWRDYSRYSSELEEYCIRDVHINHKVYLKYKKYTDNPKHQDSIRREHRFQLVVNNMEGRGFALDIDLTKDLLREVTITIAELDQDIHEVFQPRLKLIREVTPRATKFGTISLSSIPKNMRDNIHELDVDAPFSYCHWVEFNPGSTRQVVQLLNEAAWEPTVKTKGHVETEREVSRLSRSRKRTREVDLKLKELILSLDKLKVSGWKVNETNLATLPPSAPAPARLLAKRINYESRRKTLTEWLGLVQPDGRVHGQFQAIGTWTHRMSHQKPNMANVANEFFEDGSVKLLGKELRSCWIAPKGRLLVGVDAESIQLRIFAHYVNDPALIKAIVEGNKRDKTDPHNFNKSVLGDACPSRQAAKRYLYALLLGGGKERLRQILGCSSQAAEEALDRLLRQYPGFQKIREEIIPSDAERGWFTGIDGRRVRLYGDTVSERRHLAMSGYLQNGEAIVIKEAAIQAEPLIAEYNSFFVDIVHDEYQIETPDDMEVAVKVAGIVDTCIRDTTDTFNLRCLMAGSYWNDDHNRYNIGNNWYFTH